jgi:citronellol/citronellal dehydrogenase
VAYLASPAGDYFSGAVLTIDGGRDNWFGAWPPARLTDEAGKPLAEERRSER